MEITDELVRHLESLACLRLDDDARARMRADLARIVEYMQQLESLDTDDVAPTTMVPVEGTSELRADVERDSFTREAILGNAPEARDGFYRVPRVLGDADEGAPA